LQFVEVQSFQLICLPPIKNYCLARVLSNIYDSAVSNPLPLRGIVLFYSSKLEINPQMKNLRKIHLSFLVNGLTIIILVLLISCEGNERFYRPDLPERLSALSIIDADDTTRYIIFEKSFQAEYPGEDTDSLRELSFTISDADGVIYSFQSGYALKNQSLIRIPNSITFFTGEKYFFRAKERDCPEISSEIAVREPPSGLKLLDVSKEIVTNYLIECHDVNSDPVIDAIKISFDNAESKNSYYALLIESYGFIPSGGIIPGESWYYMKPWKSYIEFTVKESDALGFFAIFPGLIRYNTDPCDDYKLIENPAHAYYMEISNIPYGKSTIVLTTQSYDGISVPAVQYTFRIKLLSIPEEMYFFIKSLYTYERNTGDPFSEPAYLKGNIEGGYGIFAICRSIELHVDAPPGY